MNTSFKEFTNRRNIEIGIRCLVEAEQNALDDKVVNRQVATQVPPMPKSIQVPTVPPKEKSWARKWWDKNKTMLKYGALGAAAIGLLLGSGIPWGSLFPYMARTIGTGLGVNAVLGGANSIIGTNQNNMTSELGTPTKIIIRDHDCFVKTKFGEIKVSPSQIPDMILRNSNGSGDYSAVIWRTETSRTKTEIELANALRDKGLEDSVHWRDSFSPVPHTVDVPEFLDN